MPKIYLSPSVQEFNPYIDGGNEEYYMYLIADAMEPYLTANGIDFDRNQPEMTLSQVIADSNAQDYDLHLAIHSNASPQNQSGKNTGVEIYHYPTSEKGIHFARTIANNYKSIYPEPEKIRLVPTYSLAEIRRTKAPAVLIEVGYHDNRGEAQWIRDNIENIARNLAKSVTEYFNQEFVEP
jgi:N-acetylmuramoyl-L-alanine amidase